MRAWLKGWLRGEMYISHTCRRQSFPCRNPEIWFDWYTERWLKKEFWRRQTSVLALVQTRWLLWGKRLEISFWRVFLSCAPRFDYILVLSCWFHKIYKDLRAVRSLLYAGPISQERQMVRMRNRYWIKVSKMNDCIDIMKPALAAGSSTQQEFREDSFRFHVFLDGRTGRFTKNLKGFPNY